MIGETRNLSSNKILPTSRNKSNSPAMPVSNIVLSWRRAQSPLWLGTAWLSLRVVEREVRIMSSWELHYSQLVAFFWRQVGLCGTAGWSSERCCEALLHRLEHWYVAEAVCKWRHASACSTDSHLADSVPMWAIQFIIGSWGRPLTMRYWLERSCTWRRIRVRQREVVIYNICSMPSRYKRSESQPSEHLWLILILTESLRRQSIEHQSSFSLICAAAK